MTVRLMWVQRPKGTEGNETANQLAKLGSESLLIGPEPACSISAEIATKAVRDLTEIIKNTRSP